MTYMIQITIDTMSQNPVIVNEHTVMFNDKVGHYYSLVKYVIATQIKKWLSSAVIVIG